MGPKVKAQKIGTGEPLLLIEALIKTPANLSQVGLLNGGFQRRLQQEWKPKAILTARLAPEKT